MKPRIIKRGWDGNEWATLHKSDKGTWSSEEGWVRHNMILRTCRKCKKQVYFNLVNVERKNIPQYYKCNKCK